MADVQSPFNPSYEKKHEETYLNYSRGADAPRAEKGFTPLEESSAILDAGKLGLTVVAAKDEIYKRRSQQEVVEGVDAIRDAWTGATAGGATSANVPADLRKQLETLEKRTGQYASGAISDRYYWAQMENVARTVRARYPGYREHIDNIISGMTGATPANALQRSISNEADNVDAAGKALRTELKDLKNTIAKSDLTPYTDEVEKSNDPEFLRKYINKYQVNEGRIKRMREDLTAGDAQDARTIKKAESLANEETNLVIARTMEGPVNELIGKYRDLLKPGQRPSPDEVAAIGQQTQYIRGLWAAETEKVFNRPEYANVSSDWKKAKIAEVESRIENIGKAISNGNWEIVNAEANTFDMINKGNAVNIIKGSETAAGMAAIKAVAGDIGVEKYLSLMNKNGKSNLNSLGDEIDKIDLLNFANPNTPVQPLQKIVESAKDNDNIVDKSASISKRIDTTIGVLTDKEIPASMKERAAESLFGPKNINFLADPLIAKGKNGRGRIAVFKQMTSPEVAQGMLEIKASNPALYENYTNWRNYTFTNLFKRDLDTIAQIPSNDQTMNIQFDAKTGKLIEQSRGPSNAWDSMVSYVAGSSPAVRNYNEYIDAMTPTWKLEGLNPGEEAQKIVDAMGINFNAGKGDNLFTMIGKAFSDAAAVAKENLSKEPITKGVLTAGGGSRESLKRDLGVSYTPPTPKPSLPKSVDAKLVTTVENVPTIENLDEVKSITASYSDRMEGSKESKNIVDVRPAPEYAQYNDDELLNLYNGYGQKEVDGTGKRTAEDKAAQSAIMKEMSRRNMLNLKGGNNAAQRVLDPDDPEGIQEIIEKLRNIVYTPGSRESTNIEDRRNDSKGFLQKIAQFLEDIDEGD